MIATLTGYSKNETGVRCYSVRDWSTPMCDYSLELVASRPAKVGDKLVSTSFAHTITRGFVSVDDPNLAVCVLPALSLFSRRRSDARLECCSLGGLGTRWRTLAGLVVLANNQQLLARRSIVARTNIRHPSVADIKALDNGEA